MSALEAAHRGTRFSKGDLVWYHHPSGPWIPGRLTNVMRGCCQVRYGVTTDQDGVKRLAWKEDVRLRTTTVAPPPSGMLCNPQQHNALTMHNLTSHDSGILTTFVSAQAQVTFALHSWGMLSIGLSTH